MIQITEEQAKQAWDYWYPLVYGYFYRRISNASDVEDLVANTITALLLKENVRNPKAFVWQTARNQLVEYIKQKTKKPDIVDLESRFDLAANQNLEYYNEEEVEATLSSHFLGKLNKLSECIKNHLKDEDYKIVWASIIDNKNSTEIGSELNLKASTVRQKLKRAIAKLQKTCTELWEDLAANSKHRYQKPPD